MQTTKEKLQPRISRRGVLRNVLGLSAVALMGTPKKAEAHPDGVLYPIFGEWDETVKVISGLAVAATVIIYTGRKRNPEE